MNTFARSKSRWTVSVSLAALGSLSLLGSACSRAQGQELPPAASVAPPVIAVGGDAGGAPRTQSAPLLSTGATHAIEQAELSAKVSGTLSSLAVAEGDLVKKGQVLFRIDASSAELQVRQAQTQLSAAQVALSGEELEFRRTRELASTGAVSAAALDTAKLQYDQARVAVDQAKVAVATASKAVADTVVKSPVSGVVAKKLKQVGESVAANGAPVLIVQDISRLEVRASVPETALASVKAGDRMQVRVRALGKSYETTIARINPSVDTRSRTVEIVGVLDNAGGELKAGLLTEVTFPGAGKSAPESRASVALPADAGRSVQ